MNQNILNRKYYNTKEFAEAVGVTQPTASRWVKKGLIYGKKQGRRVMIDEIFVKLIRNKNYDMATKITELLSQGIDYEEYFENGGE